MKSIIQNEKVCYITGDEYNLHKHHVFNGGVNRKLSEHYGWSVEDFIRIFGKNYID